MAGRALFICSAKAGPELRAGVADCEKLAKVLRNPRFGEIDDTVSPPMLLDCADDSDFLSRINSFFKLSGEASQRIVYITGHGKVMNGQYCLVFDGKDRLPFSSVVGLLSNRGAAKTLFVLDTCHSGAAEMGGIKSDEVMPSVPAGSCILASSRDYELSHEHAEFGSLFTHFLCECITTGNGGQRTTDGLITVPDAVTYIKAKISGLGGPAQNPIYSIRNSDGALWIARNVSGTADALPTDGEDRFRLPCPGALVQDLDADLTKAYAEKYLGGPVDDLDGALPKLDLFYSTDDHRLTKAAILCFGSRPERFFPAAGSVFCAGDLASPTFQRASIEGPLAAQAERLVQQTLSQLGTAVTFGAEAQRTEESEIPPQVLREVILNALAHRDFDAPGRVQIHVDDNRVEIQNPGHFPPDYGWDAFLDRPGISLAPNRRVANHLQHVGLYEGAGRGFSVLKRYREERGAQALQFKQIAGLVVCELMRPKKMIRLSRNADARNAKVGLQRYLADRVASMRNVRSLTGEESYFVKPTLQRENGASLTLKQFRKMLQTPGRRILLEGEAGSGKSHLLRHYAQEMAQEVARDSEVPEGSIPLLIPLRGVSTDIPLLAVLRHAVGEVPGLLEFVLDQPRVTVMFDGLDEAVPPNRDVLLDSIARLQLDFPHVTVVISSRPIEAFADQGDSDRIRIGPLSKAAITDFVRQARPDFEDRLLRQLKAYPEFAASPLLLGLVIATFDQFAEIPRDSDLLADQAFEVLFMRHDRQKTGYQRMLHSALSIDEFSRAAGSLALIMISQATFSLTETEFVSIIGQALRIAGSTALPRDFASDLVEVGLMRRDGLNVEFIHRSLMERLAVRAVAVLDMPVPTVAALVARLLAVNPSSDLPLKMVQLWGRRPEQISDLVLQLKNQDLRGEATGVRDELVTKLEQLVVELEDQSARYLELFGRSDS